MDNLWFLVILVLWTQREHASAQNCTYGEVGSLTLTCTNLTATHFKNITYKFDELIETVRCDNCTLNILEESSFEFRGNRIITLDLKSTGIKEIKPGAFMGLNFLEKLLLSDNTISEISPGILKGLKKIRILTIQNNTIASLKTDVFANATSLKKLNLHKNQIKSIEPKALSGLKNLADLDLSANSLTTLDGVFTGLPSLQNLNLSYNEISSLSGGEFKDLISLSKLILSYNKIATIPIEEFVGLPLVYLDLSHNMIKLIKLGSFKNMFSIEHIDLCHNQIEEIPKKIFQRLDNLYDLNMAHNNLTMFETGIYSSGSPELRKLNLSNNQIISIDINGVFKMENLHTLDLSCNKISDLNYTKMVSHMPRLSYVDLNDNMLPCYLKDEMNKYFENDTLDFVLFEETPELSKKCDNRTKPVPELSKASNNTDNNTNKNTDAKANSSGPTNHSTAVNPSLKEAIETIARETIDAEEGIILFEVKEGKLTARKDDHYNSRPAIIVLSMMLCGVIIAMIFLSYSHWVTRRIVKQHSVQRALSQIQLFSSDAEFDTPGNLQM